MRETDLCQCTIYYCWDCEDSGYVYEEKTAEVLSKENIDVLQVGHLDNAIRYLNGQELLSDIPVSVTHAVVTKPCTNCYVAWRNE